MSGTDSNPPSRFNTAARTLAAGRTLQQATSNEERAKLTVSQKEKLRVGAISGLDTKFGMHRLVADQAVGTDLLTQNFEISHLIEQVRKRCENYGMIDVFTLVIPDPTSSNPGAVQTTTVKDVVVTSTLNLFDSYSSVTRQQVQASSEHYLLFGQDFDVENLKWSEDFLSNSCEPDLRNKINENMMLSQDTYQGGPLFFYELIQIILTLTADDAEAMKTSIKTMTLQDFQGENVDKAVTLLRASIKRFKLIDEVPLNISDQLTEIFQTASVDKFKQSFILLQTMNGMQESSYDPESILETASRYYKKLAAEWNVPDNHKTSTFTAGTRRGPICWGCGKPGHTIQNCRSTNDADRKRILKERRQNRPVPGTANPSGQNTRPDLVPPKENEKQVKQLNGSTVKWCQTCRRWGNHSTTEHVVGYKKQTPNTDQSKTVGFLSQISEQMS